MFSLNFLIFYLLTISAYSQVEKQCCQSYDKSKILCMTCPKGYYFKGNNCFFEVNGCQQYSDCLTCSKCRVGFNLVDGKFDDLSVKKCKQQGTYSQIDLNSKQQGNKLYQSFLIADDYMRSFHKEVTKGKVIGAFNKKFENGSQVLEIQYSASLDGKQKYFKSGMSIVIQKFQFKEVFFQEIPSSDLRKNILNPVSAISLEGCIGTDLEKQEYIEKTLDLRQSINLKIVQNIDTITRGSNSNFKKLLSVKVRIYKEKKQIQITYITNEDLPHSYLIDPTTRRVISINGKPIYQVRAVLPPVPISETNNLQKQQQNSALGNAKGEVKQASQRQGAKTIEKTQNENQIPSPVQDKNGVWTKFSTVGYVSENNINLLKDIYFLVIKDLINKKLSGYQDILPTSTFIKADAQWKYFLMSYTKTQGTQTILTQILSKIKISNFQPEIVFEHKIAIIETSNNPQNRIYVTKEVSEVMKSSFYISAAVQILKVNSAYKTQNLVSIAVNQEDSNVVYFKSVFNITGRIWQVESLTKKKLRIGQVLSQKDITPPPPPPPSPVPAPTSVAKENNSTFEGEKSNKSNQSSSNPSQSTIIIPPVNCQVFKTTPKAEELLKFAKNPELGPNVLNQVGGFGQLSEGAAKADSSFLRAEAFIECTNGKNLKDTQILAVFSKVFGFSIQYKIFYETPKKTIYLVYAALDRLKSKIYIVNFNAISFGIN